MSSGAHEQPFRALNELVDLMGQNSRLITMREWMDNVRQFLMDGPRDYLTINDLFPTSYDGATIVVTGSGPSLMEDAERLHDIETTVIAGATNLSYLIQQGCTPDILMVADCNPILWVLANEWRDCLRDTKVVVPFTASPLWWRRPIGKGPYFYKNLLQIRDLRPDEYAPNIMYTSLFPRGPFILQAGCVTNAMLLLIDHLWQRWGVKRVVLLGVDYSVPEDISIPGRVPFVTEGNSFEAESFSPFYADRKKFNERLVTMKDLTYAAATLQIRKEMKFDVHIVTKNTILYPYIDLVSIVDVVEKEAAVVRQQLFHGIPREEALDRKVDEFIKDSRTVVEAFLADIRKRFTREGPPQVEVPGLAPEGNE